MGASDPVLTRRALDDAVEDLFYSGNAFVVDVETKGRYRLDPRRNEVFWVGFAGAGGRSVVIPCGHPVGRVNGETKEPRQDRNGRTRWFRVPTFTAPPAQLRVGEVMEAIRPLFWSPLRIIGHNIKFDIESCAKYWGELPPGPYADTQMTEFLLNENRHQYSLDKICERRLGVKMDKSISAEVEKHPFAVAARYLHLDVRRDWQIWRDTFWRVRAEGFTEPVLGDHSLWHTEEETLEALAHMETIGVLLDRAAAERVDDNLEKWTAEVKRDLYRIAGRVWNLDSNPQKQAVFYGPRSEGGQGLNPIKTTKGGAPSCDDEALKAHVGNPLVDAYLEYGDLTKMRTYTGSWLGTVERKAKNRNKNDAPGLGDDGRIHANFKPHGAKTGRLSCVSSDALIEMPRDLSRYPMGVPITDVQPGDWVYGFDWRRELVLKRVRWVGQTGVRQTVVITVRNSEGDERTLRLTPDHLVRLWNGDWRPAGSLAHRHGDPHRSDGPRVMTMVKRTLEDGYVRFYPHAVARSGGTKGGGRNREHRWIAGQVRGRSVSTKADVHHRNGNRADNSVGNLEVLPVREHRGSREVHEWGRGVRIAEPVLYDGPMDYRVVSVSPGLVEPVWDMEVEEVHAFIANGICVHNCSEPNLQNIPKAETELGKEIRGMFVREPGRMLLVADYAQIEYVVLAHFSRDPELIRYFEQGLNFHYAVASRLLQKPIEDITKPEYSTCKNTNFATVYGAGDEQVARMSGVTVAYAREFRRMHKRMLPRVYQFTDDVIRVCKSRRPPHVKTLLGRKRRLPEIFAGNDQVRLRAERQAVNAVIQGSAADINKLALVRLHRTAPSWMWPMLNVHDEFVVSVPEDRVADGSRILERAMVGPGIGDLMAVQLRTDVKAVERWSEAKD